MAGLETMKHVEYIKSLDKKKDMDSVLTEHLRMSGAYWGLTTMDMLGRLEEMDKGSIISWVLQCQHDCGNLRLHKIDLEKAIDFVAQCKNFDGGYGCTPGAESHAGQIFCCVGALAIAGALHNVDKDLLGWWLCERQVPSGGLNGRPEKLPDVCYSWWVLSSLAMIDRVHWINKEKLKNFILACQDKDHGGISDRPDDAVDVFHTFFGIAGLSLLEFEDLKPIDPAYALPVHVIDNLFYGS